MQEERRKTLTAVLFRLSYQGAVTSRKFKDIYRHDQLPTATLKGWDPAGKRESRKGQKRPQRKGRGPAAQPWP